MGVVAPSDARTGRRAVATLEMVFLLPLLLMLLFALGELSVMFGRWLVLSNAAREGARAAIVYRSDCVMADVTAEVRQTIKDYATPTGIALSDPDIEILGACGDAGSNATVSVTFTHTFQVLPAFAPSMGPSIVLVGRSAMRNEGNT